MDDGVKHGTPEWDALEIAHVRFGVEVQFRAYYQWIDRVDRFRRMPLRPRETYRRKPK